VLREEREEEEAISSDCSFLLFHTVLAWNHDSHLSFILFLVIFTLTDPTSRLDSRILVTYP